MIIQIHNLSPDITDKQLRKMFEAFGTVISAVVSRNQFNGRSNRNGLVEMLKEKDGENAISSLNQTVIDGKLISLLVFDKY